MQNSKGPVKWNDAKKEKKEPFNLKKALPLLIISVIITAAILISTLRFSNSDHVYKVKEVKILQTSYKDGKRSFEFLQTIDNYDTSGKLLRRREYNERKFKTHETRYTYGAGKLLLEVLSIEYKSEFDSVKTKEIYQYRDGRLTRKIRDTFHITQYEFNPSGLLQSENDYDSIPGKNYGLFTRKMAYLYDNKGRKIKMYNDMHPDDFSDPAKRFQVNYLYNAKGQLIQSTESRFDSSVISKYSYNPKGNLTRKEEGDQVYNFRYDDYNRKTEEWLITNKKLVYKRIYSYEFFPED